MLTSDICVFYVRGCIPHVCSDSMLVQAVVPFLYPEKLRLSSPSSFSNVFLGQQAAQTSPLPPAPIPPPTHSLLPHVLLSVNVPIILHASLFSFSRPFVLLMLRPHRHPGPAHPRWLAMAPCAAGCGPNWMLRFLMHCWLSQTGRVGTHAVSLCKVRCLG